MKKYSYKKTKRTKRNQKRTKKRTARKRTLSRKKYQQKYTFGYEMIPHLYQAQMVDGILTPRSAFLWESDPLQRSLNV
jgi:hypothetical protein